MPDAYGIIEVTEHRDIRGNVERRDYRWEGPPTTKLSWDLMYLTGCERVEGGDVISFGPYALKIVEERPWDLVIIATRMDKPFWWMRYLWHRYNKGLDLAYRRFIKKLRKGTD